MKDYQKEKIINLFGMQKLWVSKLRKLLVRLLRLQENMKRSHSCKLLKQFLKPFLKQGDLKNKELKIYIVFL